MVKDMTIKVEFDTGAVYAYLPNYTSTMRDVRSGARRCAPKGASKYRIIIESRIGRMRTFWRTLKTL